MGGRRIKKSTGQALTPGRRVDEQARNAAELAWVAAGGSQQARCPHAPDQRHVAGQPTVVLGDPGRYLGRRGEPAAGVGGPARRIAVDLVHPAQHRHAPVQVLRLSPAQPHHALRSSTWTGSVVRGPDGVWFMFSTGGGSREHGLKQRVGLATSADLDHWTKHPASPVLESDPRWYEQYRPLPPRGRRSARRDRARPRC
jgi:hypothetical protein